MATHVRVRESRKRTSRSARIRWPAPAWGAIGVTALFVGITCWWLTQDRSIPIFDAGLHLSLAIGVHHELSSGHLLGALTLTLPYPPFAYLVGSLGILAGGVGVAPPILAENLVFVPLLALGCYQLGRLAFGPLAGLLAVVFALGSPLITAQFHVFMIDAPETAMVAVSVWLIVLTDGFSRLKACALAGVAVGLGMLTKEPFAFFVVGIVCVTALRGGRGALRGFALFAAVALAIALPWYVHEYTQMRLLATEATDSYTAFIRPGKTVPNGIAPPRLSLANLEWYLRNFLDAQIYLPLFVFAAVGWVWTMVGFARRRPVSPLALELAVGAFTAWAILTETFVHDPRYSMPLLVYLAVFGSGWIVRLARAPRIAAAAALALVALANTLGASFGVGGGVAITIPHGFATALGGPGSITIYENAGYLVSAPQRDGDLIAVLQALRHDGVRNVTWFPLQALEPDFSTGGLMVLAQIAGLGRPDTVTYEEMTRKDATLDHTEVGSGPPPCVRLDDGTGVWVRIGNPFAPGAKDYCPLPRPHFYG